MLFHSCFLRVFKVVFYPIQDNVRCGFILQKQYNAALYYLSNRQMGRNRADDASNVNFFTCPLRKNRLYSHHYKFNKTHDGHEECLNMDKRNESLPARHGWRWHMVVAIVLLLVLVFIVLGFVLVMDPNWAYEHA